MKSGPPDTSPQASLGACAKFDFHFGIHVRQPYHWKEISAQPAVWSQSL